MSISITRRTMTKRSLMMSLATYTALAARNPTFATAAIALDPGDPSAKALGFVVDAGSVNAAANPSFKQGQMCSSCAQYQGKAGEGVAACNVFPGHTVPAGGWCKVWAQKPGGT
jgi:hypothetical protein